MAAVVPTDQPQAPSQVQQQTKNHKNATADQNSQNQQIVNPYLKEQEEKHDKKFLDQVSNMIDAGLASFKAQIADLQKQQEDLYAKLEKEMKKEKGAVMGNAPMKI